MKTIQVEGEVGLDFVSAHFPDNELVFAIFVEEIEDGLRIYEENLSDFSNVGSEVFVFHGLSSPSLIKGLFHTGFFPVIFSFINRMPVASAELGDGLEGFFRKSEEFGAAMLPED